MCCPGRGAGGNDFVTTPKSVRVGDGPLLNKV